MRLHIVPRVLAAALIVVAASLAGAQPAAASHGSLAGTVTDKVAGAPIGDVCITIGPPVRCATFTKNDGTYFVSLEGAPDGLAWDLGFYRDNAGCQTDPSLPSCFYSTPVLIPGVVVNGPTVVNAQMTRDPGAPPIVGFCPPLDNSTPTATNYLPNITKTLGGPTGWQTPFITQNTGAVTTRLEVSFYKFIDGTCVTRRIINTLAPGASFADVPNNDTDLPGDTQFSVVVRSFGAPIVSVVNEHAGVGDRAEALSYDGFSGGATNVFLPNITRRFFGYVTPLIIQNLGGGGTVATAQFISRDGSAPPLTVTRAIDAGRSKFVDPNSEVGLVDGKAYSVTVTAPVPIAVVVNSHQDASFIAHPVAYSADGITAGAQIVYGAYAAKNAAGIGRLSTVVVQNVGTTATNVGLTFTPLGGGTDTTIPLGSVQIGGSVAFDPRYQAGDTTKPLCGSAATADCLADGEYSFTANASGGTIAAVVNVISPETAMGYSATGTPATRYFLPNVTRTLGGSTGWTTPIVLQSVTATGASVKWFSFSDQALVFQQSVSMPAGTAIRIDPRSLPQLADNKQYSVVVEGTGATSATLDAIVIELATGGDSAMIYEGFPAATTP